MSRPLSSLLRFPIRPLSYSFHSKAARQRYDSFFITQDGKKYISGNEIGIGLSGVVRKFYDPNGSEQMADAPICAVKSPRWWTRNINFVNEQTIWNLMYPHHPSYVMKNAVTSRLIMPYMGTQDFGEIIQDIRAKKDLMAELKLALACAEEILRVHALNISHGDIHKGNIRIDTENNDCHAYLIDTDQSIQHAQGGSWEAPDIRKFKVLLYEECSSGFLNKKYIDWLIKGVRGKWYVPIDYPLTIFIAVFKYELALLMLKDNPQQARDLIAQSLATPNLLNFNSNLYYDLVFLNFAFQKLQQKEFNHRSPGDTSQQLISAKTLQRALAEYQQSNKYSFIQPSIIKDLRRIESLVNLTHCGSIPLSVIKHALKYHDAKSPIYHDETFSKLCLQLLPHSFQQKLKVFEPTKKSLYRNRFS